MCHFSSPIFEISMFYGDYERSYYIIYDYIIYMYKNLTEKI